MKKFRLLTLATLIATILSTGCDKDDPEQDPNPNPDPDPDPVPVELVNQYEWNTKVTDIKSVVAAAIPTEIAMPIYIFLSPEEGITSMEELMASEKEYVMLAIDSEIGEYPEMVTETDTSMRIDLTKAQGVVYMWYMKNGEAVAAYEDETLLDEGYMIIADDPANEDRSTVDMLFDFAGSDNCLRANFGLNESDIVVPTPEYPENYIAEDATSVEEIQSAFVFDMGPYTFVVMSPTAGYASWSECMEGENYISIAVPTAELGQTIDMTAHQDYSFSNYTQLASQIVDISPLDPESLTILSKGEMRVAKDGEYTDVSFSIETTDGTLFEGKALVNTPAPTNFITFNDGTKNINAAFYYENYLYLTPGAIDYGQDIGDCSQYLCLTMPVKGETVDVATATDEFMVIFTYDYGESQIMSQNGTGDTGSYTVKSLGKNSYEVTMDITFADGNRLQCKYSGEFKDFLAEPVKQNEYKFDGVSHAINSLIVDTTSSIYTFYISEEAGLNTVDAIKAASDVIAIKADASICDGGVWGFSSAANADKELSVIYKGATYNSASGSIGTFSALLSGAELELSFAGYGETPDVYFKGEAVVVK